MPKKVQALRGNWKSLEQKPSTADRKQAPAFDRSTSLT